MTTIISILDEFREAKISNRDMGDKFERLVAGFLTIDPLYRDKYSDVWLWNEWPGRNNKPDVGIDLVAQERYTGEFCAIQCKFYDPLHTLQRSDIDSFFTASGKSPFSSRIIISTTDKWSVHAEDALSQQHIPVVRLGVQDLADSPIDWSEFTLSRPDRIKLKKKKALRPHQSLAVDEVMDRFEQHDRGKLIMACGTGKTFATLKIAERFAEQSDTGQAFVLFLVPSISLLSQSLREWSAEASVSLHSFAVCSDTQVGKKVEAEDITTHDLAFPATTDAGALAAQIKKQTTKTKLAVVFSTYHSIAAVAEAQTRGVPAFDLVICDEAHRTTGVTLDREDESHFLRVHDANFISAKKRLYMTATPRIYSDSTKVEAQENEAVLCSMDDEAVFGPEFHRLGFSEAVRTDLLSDYKVMVLAVDEKYVSKAFQAQIADENNEINLDDVVKITGCWNGLSKRMARNADGNELELDSTAMRRAVAFSRSIKDSKRFAETFRQIVHEYRQRYPDDESVLSCETDHVDGSFNVLRRNTLLSWLKADTVANTCRVLSNARCLSEGVDVPALDAVIFLNPRNSIVDVVQSVGRVMRKAEGKKYGYVILPIGIPADVTPEEALKDNNKYKVVWQVLQALRAHDDRFNATVNQIELNKSRPDQIQVIGVGGPSSWESEGQEQAGTAQNTPTVQFTFQFPNIDQWRDAIYARIVVKCGDRRYWESWAKDVAQIAERHITRIKAVLEGSHEQPRRAFQEFLSGLQVNLNASVTELDAIEMLSQHLITKPVFDALFENYSFTQQNPVSLSMQNILNVLEGQALGKEVASLEKFYLSVKERAAGIDNAAGKQKIILELYDKFFRTAFPRMAERLGIVYTPVEIVDFILHSADEALRREFGVGLTDKDVHVLDPFAGTGTFIVRLLQSGLIRETDLVRKYREELHANEIVLLAYYIAAVNLEQAFQSISGLEYEAFQGIVLADTFQMMEVKGAINDIMFPENNKRAATQKSKPIRVVITNPPYSALQESENDGNKNVNYPKLDDRIAETYVAKSTATNKNSLYDSYIRAIRLATDRIGDKGIVCFVTNSKFIDGNAADGLRRSLLDDFTSVYCFDLRGNARTQGEARRMEGGNAFGDGTRSGIAITLLVKNPTQTGPSKLYYYDIGDYLSRSEKLHTISQFGSATSIPWAEIKPNASSDWINQRDPAFANFIPLGDKDAPGGRVMFDVYSIGLKSNRDPWVYNFSKAQLTSNMQRMIENYNTQMQSYKELTQDLAKAARPSVDDFVNTDSKKVSWTVNLKNDVVKGVRHHFDASRIATSMYRPFCKQWLYFDRPFNERVYTIPKLFPSQSVHNLCIAVSGVGASKLFSALIADCIPNLHLQDTGQCFPMYYFISDPASQDSDDAAPVIKGLESVAPPIRRDAIAPRTLAEFKSLYGEEISSEDLFYYVYGILHSEEYKHRFASDLKKVLPGIPFADDFWAFSKAGRTLAYWHLNYENVEPYPLKEYSKVLGLNNGDDLRVRKMTFGKKDKAVDKSTIVFNSQVTLTDIPPEAYQYVVNGKPAIEWVMERYQFSVDRDSQIHNDPNDWSEDPRYIIDLLKRIVRVSLETVKIVKTLPPLNERMQVIVTSA